MATRSRAANASRGSAFLQFSLLRSQPHGAQFTIDYVNAGHSLRRSTS